jgi:hypothetical protein
MPSILLIVKKLQGLLRNFFAIPLSQRLGFFANLRTTCEDFANEGKLCLCSVSLNWDLWDLGMVGMGINTDMGIACSGMA